MSFTVLRRRIAPYFASRTARLLLLPGVLCLAGPADAGTGTPQPAATVIAERPVPPFLLISRDPETGGWTLAPLEVAAARSAMDLDRERMALNQSHEGLVAVPLRGGGFALDLQGRFQSYSLARRDAQGLTLLGCEDEPLSLFRWLTEPAPELDAFGRPVR